MRVAVLLPVIAMAPMLSGCMAYTGLGQAYPYGGYAGGRPVAPYRPWSAGQSAWYLDHPVERQAELMQCQHSPNIQGDPGCMAAIQADRQEASRERASEQFGSGGRYGMPIGGMIGPIVVPQLK